MVNEISFEKRGELKTFIGNNKNVIIRVSASWCGPCKRIKPLLEEKINNLPNNIKVVFVDFDKHRDVASALKIKNVPTFMFYNNGYPDICLVGGDGDKVAKFFDNVVSKVSN